MAQDAHTIELITERWQDDGITLRVDGQLATLEFNGLSLTRPWTEIGDDAARTHRPATSFAGLLVVGGKITPRIAHEVREAGGWYIDAAGSAYIRARGVHVDVQGRLGRRSQGRGGNTAPEINLLSARRAQVIFCLLTWPGLVEKPRRALATAAGVSLSIAQSTVSTLTEERYLFPGSARIQRHDELLDRWADAYPLGLGRSLELGRFSGEPDPSPLLDSGVDVLVSGELATDGLQGSDLTLYVQEFMPSMVATMRWRRPESRESANIVLRRRFWTTPPGAPDAARDVGSEIPRVPPLLVYADLLASREPRQIEAAHQMRGELVER